MLSLFFVVVVVVVVVGVCMRASGRRYTGSWSEGRMHGAGEMTFEDGQAPQIGQWVLNEFNVSVGYDTQV